MEVLGAMKQVSYKTEIIGGVPIITTTQVRFRFMETLQVELSCSAPAVAGCCVCRLCRRRVKGRTGRREER